MAVAHEPGRRSRSSRRSHSTTCTHTHGRAGIPRRPPGTGWVLALSSRGRGHLCRVTITSVRWPHGETLVGLEAWGAEGPSAGKRVCLGEAEASSGAAAAAAGHGGREAGGDDQVPGDGGPGAEEAGTQLGFAELSLEVGGASGSFPRRPFAVL